MDFAIMLDLEQASRYIRCIRFKDVVLLQGSPALGVALAFRPVGPEALFDVLVFFGASCLLVAHVFVFNDWSDIDLDHRDHTKARETFMENGLSTREMGFFSLGLAVASVLLFSLLPVATFLLALGTIAAGLLYSDACVRAKRIPIVSSLLHLGGGLLHFLAGYSLFGAVDARALLIGLYFALIFAAGHLIQEIRDYNGDRASEVQTNAVYFGRRHTLATSFLLFSASYAYLFCLGYTGIVPEFFALIVIIYPLQAFLFWRMIHSGITFRSVKRFQSQYRVIYGLIGVLMMAGLFNRLLAGP